MKSFTYKGHTWPSLTAFAKDKGVHERTIARRLSRGVHPDNVLQSERQRVDIVQEEKSNIDPEWDFDYSFVFKSRI